MKTKAKFSYRKPKVWCVQPPKERKRTLCNDSSNDQYNDLYTDDQYNDQYNTPYNPYNNDPYDNDPYDNDPYDNYPYTDDLYTDDPYNDSYRTLYNKAYNDLHNKDINPSILALVAKFDLEIENFFASLTMSKTPSTSIPTFVRVYENHNLENYKPNTHADEDLYNNNSADYLAYYNMTTPDSIEFYCPAYYYPDDNFNVDNSFDDNSDDDSGDDFDDDVDDNFEDDILDNADTPDIFLSAVSFIPNAVKPLPATMGDHAHSPLLISDLLACYNHPMMNDPVLLLPSNHESPLPPPEPPPPGPSSRTTMFTSSIRKLHFFSLHSAQSVLFTPTVTCTVQAADVRSVGG
jgi:hypothetical protein